MDTDQGIRVTPTMKKNQVKRWAKKDKAYLQFVMTKQGQDTFNALNMLAKILRRNNKSFSIAGTKDKHAITSQNVTAYHVRSTEIIRFAPKLQQNNIWIGNFEYVSEQIKLGNLYGNHFNIVLRNVGIVGDMDGNLNDILNERLKYIEKHGFINYFGLQRFGGSTVGTHQIGSNIIKGDLEGAIAMLLLPRNDKKLYVTNKRSDFYKTGDVNCLPAFLKNERYVINYLSERKENMGNYLEALMRVPRNMRTMYVHAYQSFIWNKTVSYRVEKYGYNVIEGDIIKKGDEYACVTEEDMKEYSIFDVVLPLPSSECVWPKNGVTE